MRQIYLISLLMMTILLSACGGKSIKYPDIFHIQANLAEKETYPVINTSLSVSVPSALAIYEGHQLYLKTNEKFIPIANIRLADRLPILIQNFFVQTLKHKNIFVLTEKTQNYAKTTYNLRIDIADFTVKQKNRLVNLSLYCLLIRNKDQKVIVDANYQISLPLKAIERQAILNTYNQALNKILNKFIVDVNEGFKYERKAKSL